MGYNEGVLKWSTFLLAFSFAVIDLLHDIVALFHLPYNLITASECMFGNMSGRSTCETTICLFTGITHFSAMTSKHCKQ